MGKALLALGRNEEAADWLRRAVQAVSPPHDLYHEALAASLARSDHRAQAEEQLRSYLRLAPGMTVSMVRHLIVPSASRAYWNALADGLSLAGLRDHAGVETRVEAPPGSHPGGEHEPPPGVTRVATDELHRMLNQGKAPLLLQMFNADVAIPGTLRFSPDTVRTNASSPAIKALDRPLEQLTGGARHPTAVPLAFTCDT